MPFERNENLSGALRASLRLIETKTKAKPEAEPYPTQTEPSPLTEVMSNSLDEELNRINQNLIAGLPEKITDESLERLVDIYRAQALRWEQDEQNKPPRKRAASKKPIFDDSKEL